MMGDTISWVCWWKKTLCIAGCMMSPTGTWCLLMAVCFSTRPSGWSVSRMHVCTSQLYMLILYTLPAHQLLWKTAVASDCNPAQNDKQNDHSLATQIQGRVVTKRCSAARLLKWSQLRRNGQPLEQGGPCLASSPAWHASWIAVGNGVCLLPQSPRPHCYLLSHLGPQTPWHICHSHPLLLRLLSSEHSVPPSKGPMDFPASTETKPRPETEPFGAR